MESRNFFKMVSTTLAILAATVILATGSAAASKYKTLHRFTVGADGYYPVAGLILDDAGNLYGTTMRGGDSSCGEGDGCGTVFRLTHGGSPGTARVVFDVAGNLYGTTRGGGAYGYGNVFKLTPNSDGSWTEHILHQFTGGKDGALSFANSGLVLDAAGNLYGTTPQGGTFGYGVVFKLYRTAAGQWAEKVLWCFSDHPGAYSQAELVFDGAGNLYGTTSGDSANGGSKTVGSVFALTP